MNKSLTKPIKISRIGVANTIDLEMQSNNHNFVADGCVVSNSHSISYSSLAYKTAWTKAHYPVEFFAALLQKSGGTNKEQTYEIKTIVNDAKLFGVKVLPPNILEGNEDFVINKNYEIIFGLGHIKGIGKNSLPAVISLGKTLSVGVGKKGWVELTLGGKLPPKGVTEALILSGAFDALGLPRLHMAAEYNMVKGLTKNEIELCQGLLKEGGIPFCNGLIDILGHIVDRTVRGYKFAHKISPARIGKINQLLKDYVDKTVIYNAESIAAYEKIYLGVAFSASDQPGYNRACLDCIEFPDKEDSSNVTLHVCIDKIRKHRDKNGKTMAFLEVSDFSYSLDGVVVFASTYNRCLRSIEEGAIVKIKGKKQGRSLLVNNIEAL